MSDTCIKHKNDAERKDTVKLVIGCSQLLGDPDPDRLCDVIAAEYAK